MGKPERRFVAVQIEIVDGPQAGSRYDLGDGESLTIGRTARSKVILQQDNYVSSLHFQIDIDGERCLLRDANSSNGTWVNGQRVTEVELKDGDRILAGQTTFMVRMESAGESLRPKATLLMARPDISMMAAQPEPAPLSETHGALVRHLNRTHAAPLYALIDVAADAALSLLLARAGAQHQPLCNGQEAPSAPSLVSLPPDTPLLADLARQAWGQGRLVFFTCSYPFDAIRKHLKTLFLARTEDGRAIRFRLQDPRLLQAFLSGCSNDEITCVFGPIQTFLAEDMRDPGKLLEFAMSPVGLRQKTTVLAGEPQAAAAGV